MSTQHYDEIMGSVGAVDSLKKNDNRQEQRIQELEKVVKDLQSSLSSEMRNQGVKVDKASADMARVTLPQAVLFTSGSVEIAAAGRKVLVNVAKSLGKGSQAVRVVGHSDALPVGDTLKSRFTDNWELSATRAAAVARVLVWGGDLAQDRIRVEGRGSAEPVADNGSKEGRAQNRRIEIFIAGS
ncbi:MAG: OmpA family protein [Mariprofundaceae bacterium]|nr:OmpA family protein [Mariprofundaceae bacterium]